MLKIGLTGSIGMGKSTTAQLFREEGVPVYDADQAVHRLYQGRAVLLIAEAFPDAIIDHSVDRQKLGQLVLNQPEQLKRLEAIIHPLVHQEEQAFVEQAEKSGAKLIVLDIPLLFETDGEARVDRIIVVSAPFETQKQRVLARNSMTEEKFQAILQRQLPDSEKRKRADFIIDTGQGIEHARHQVQQILQVLALEA